MFEMTKENRLNILRRARHILSDKKNWTNGELRSPEGTSYCVLGRALEKSVYDLGLAEENDDSFGAGGQPAIDAYQLGAEISLAKFAKENYDMTPDSVNDFKGYDETLQMLDGYIAEVQAQENGA